ncbi:hypothetical protein PCANC_10435 [Puccinia coronata f. sp. avenae]|uniref:Uncharacterized protein n=1 Tax=Puccinia coronata f. sp. avenae TaxID=200324 RepID=A0A2N5VII6_9BASI|nr:hypothetical protein PCANC_10435 [Puccinia coronata f. sp. avenae]
MKHPRSVSFVRRWWVATGCDLQEPNTGNSGGAPGPRDGDPGVSDDEQSHHRTSRSRMVATVTGSHHAVSQRREPSPRPYCRECDEAPVITTNACLSKPPAYCREPFAITLYNYITCGGWLRVSAGKIKRDMFTQSNLDKNTLRILIKTGVINE